MSLYYVLADTVVNGEIIIQGISVTYSATATAFDSSNTSFKDAAKVATINSNAAGVVAARKVIDEILIEYAYVLSDLAITSLINNSLKTNIHPIIPVGLASIASSKDDINYILDASYELPEDHMLTIPNNKTLTVPGDLTFNSNGYLVIGSSQTTKTKATADSTGCTCSATLSSSNMNFASSTTASTDTLYDTTIEAGSCITIGTNRLVLNKGLLTNNGCGKLAQAPSTAVAAGRLQNYNSGSTIGTVKNVSPGKFYTNVDAVF